MAHGYLALSLVHIHQGADGNGILKEFQSQLFFLLGTSDSDEIIK